MKTALGELTFNTGWKTILQIDWFGKSYEIVVKAKAYFEKDGITKEQDESISSFSRDKSEKIKKITTLVSEYSDNADSRFIPKTLLFLRDGSSALLCDDAENPDEGIAICISPEWKIVSQDDYL